MKTFRTLSARLSLILIAATMLFLVAFTIYLVRDRSAETNQMVLDKGVAAARTGAIATEKILNGIIDDGLFTTGEIFDSTLELVQLPSGIVAGYGSISDEALASIQKYHYATTLDSYLDNAILEIEDGFLEDPQGVFAALVDVNGYLPTHNSRYSQPLTGDFLQDRDNNRTKRLFNDEVGLSAAGNADTPYLKQVYQRDTGETMWDISAPVFVKGQHWGSFPHWSFHGKDGGGHQCPALEIDHLHEPFDAGTGGHHQPGDRLAHEAVRTIAPGG